jgi:hypothetical protein
VRKDVVDGLVSRERAREVYRVALDERLALLDDETAALRAS